MCGTAPAAARCAVERSDEYLCTGGAYYRHLDHRSGQTGSAAKLLRQPRTTNYEWRHHPQFVVRGSAAVVLHRKCVHLPAVGQRCCLTVGKCMHFIKLCISGANFGI